MLDHLRRLTAGILSALAILAAAAPAAAGAEGEARRPNVLLIIGDDLAAYALGCYGSSIARTPEIDRLARSGTQFERAYANSPVCTPSRQSIITGKYPHAAGVTLLRTPLSDGEVTLAERLRAAGYATAAIGKMHFNSALRHGFDVRLDQPEHRAWLREHPPEPLPAPFSEDGRTLGVWRPFRDHARIWLNGSYLPYAARDRDMAGTFFAAEAVKFLEENREKPLFLVASFTEPHSPFHFPIEDAGAYDPDSMPLYPAGPGDPLQVPLIFRDLSDAEKRRIVASYYTSATFLDRNIGCVLGALERLGLAENTLVILTGDHGYNLGHHGRFEKHCHFEPAVRAPLIVRWPGRVPAGRSERALAELADIAPTVLEAAGLPLTGTFHGRSLMPLLRGETARLRDAVFSEYLENEEAMLRTERWKFIYSSGKRARDDGYATESPTPGRTRRLYDLEADPGEMRDLSESPGHREILRDLERRLLERFAATYPPAPAPPADLQGPDLLDWYLVPRDPPPERAKK